MDQLSSTLTTLQQQRKISAEFSAGISNSGIYACFETLLKEHSASGIVLDWGAGKGLLTRRLLDLNLFGSIIAVDIQPKPQLFDPVVTWMQSDLNNPLDLESKIFDTIVSAEVIEHLENPRATVREWFRLLKPGGLLIFSTPNNESWRSILALAIRGHFVDFGDLSYPAHITALVRQDISRILKESGFPNPQFSFTNSGRIPKFPQYRWQKIPFGSFHGLRFSDNILTIVRKPEKNSESC